MFVTESLLAFTIFRDEFDVPFLLMFGFLLFVKCFHWLMADRVESVSTPSLPNFPVRWLRVKTLATSTPRAVAPISLDVYGWSACSLHTLRLCSRSSVDSAAARVPRGNMTEPCLPDLLATIAADE